MGADEQFRYLGRIVKAHGNKGELVIAPETGSQVAKEETLYVKNNAGDLIPYKVEKFQQREKSSRYSFFVKFVRIDSRTEAAELRNREVFYHGEFSTGPAEMTAGEGSGTFNGREVFEENGRYYGKVMNVMETQAHVLIEVEPVNGTKVLIPVVDEYIAEHRPSENRIIVRNLDRFSDI